MNSEMRNVRRELLLARKRWGPLGRQRITELREILEGYQLSVSRGDILLLPNGWYVTHSGLLRYARRHRCSGIKTNLDVRFSDPSLNRWVFRAVVYNSTKSKSFVGYGDADPSNVSSTVRGAELRVAETRAVNRALRKAYGIGICSVEELGTSNNSSAPVPSYEPPTSSSPSNGSGNGQARLKDKLCLLIRQHNLDSTQVKAYAAEFCGTETLRGASRELVEAFISKLEGEAREDRDRLICKLNSFSRAAEVTS